MLRLFMLALLTASLNAVAETQVPHTFSEDTVARASEVNENFDALEAAIDAIPQGPAGPQGPPGADGVAAGLSCSEDQIIVYRNDAWECSSREYVLEGFGYPTEGTVNCNGNRQVISGSCRWAGGPCDEVWDRPSDDFTGWTCTGGGNGCFLDTAWAICQ